MTIETGAKVNLTLEVLGRRPDGYHDLATVFCAVGLWDRITIEPSEGLLVTCDRDDVPDGPENLCHRAAMLLAAECGREPSVAIRIAKTVPPGGGLGGGSANAAGVLGALDRLWGCGLGTAELVGLAAGLGSDVAFFVEGGIALGTGRGHDLVRLRASRRWRVVVLAAARVVPTRAVYAALQGFRPDAGRATREVAAALRRGTTPRVELLVNQLESAACRVEPALAAERRRLDELGLAAMRLSGSGGSWYGLAGPGEAEAIAGRLRAAWPGRSVWVTEPATCGWREVSEP